MLAYPFVSTFSAGVAKAGRPLAPQQGSFLRLDAVNLQVVTLKEAEDHDGFILRLRETAGRSGTADLAAPILGVREAWLCNGVEVPKEKLTAAGESIQIPYTPNQYITVRLKTARQ
ncbi:MAG: glycosyl hydrolase-related protein [Verrucomicrobiota bacterium]